MIRPLYTSYPSADVASFAFTTDDGVALELTRMTDHVAGKPAVLVTHGLTASSDTFVLPETRNLVDVLLASGFEPWLLDWRGSCRLPYNSRGAAYSIDDVALYDIPKAVERVREHINGAPLFMIAHCVSALAVGQSLTAGLIPGLSGVITQGVFLTPKMSVIPRLGFGFMSELARTIIGDTLPVDFKKVGFKSKYSPLFALASIGSDCPDPTCNMLHNSAWCTGASLFEHDNLCAVTHDRLAELVGDASLNSVAHIRKITLANALLAWNEGDPRYRALPANSLDKAGDIDCPLLLVSGNNNKLWVDSNKLCANVLAQRFPHLNVRYEELAGYGHLDAFIGRGAAIDVFPKMADWMSAILHDQSVA